MKRYLGIALVLGWVLSLWPGQSYAQFCDITVTNGGDSGPGTLRQAVSDITTGGTICLGVNVLITNDLEIIGLNITGGVLTVDSAAVILSFVDSSVTLDAVSYGSLNLDRVNWEGDIHLESPSVWNNSSIVAGNIYLNASMDLRNVTVFSPNFEISDCTVYFYNITISGDLTGLANIISHNSIYNPPSAYLSLSSNHDISPSVANLGSLQDNGGFVHTMALLPSSSAIDAGDNATCLTTDARGITRPQHLACDIGAYELQVFPTLTPTPSPTLTPTPLPVGGVAQFIPSTPVPLLPSDCPSCDYYLPLSFNKLEFLAYQNNLVLQKLDTANFNLNVLHNDLTGLNTTIQDLSSQQQTQHQELLAAMATMDARQYSPPFYTETITTPAGSQVVTRYTISDAGSEAQLQFQLLAFVIWMSWAGYAVFRGR